MDIGIAIATSAPPFKEPNVIIRVMKTSIAPSPRFIKIVDKARLINSDLS